MADENTEQLKLDTTQPEQAIAKLIERLRQYQNEARKASTLSIALMRSSPNGGAAQAPSAYLQQANVRLDKAALNDVSRGLVAISASAKMASEAAVDLTRTFRTLRLEMEGLSTSTNRFGPSSRLLPSASNPAIDDLARKLSMFTRQLSDAFTTIGAASRANSLGSRLSGGYSIGGNAAGPASSLSRSLVPIGNRMVAVQGPPGTTYLVPVAGTAGGGGLNYYGATPGGAPPRLPLAQFFGTGGGGGGGGGGGRGLGSPNPPGNNPIFARAGYLRDWLVIGAAVGGVLGTIKEVIGLDTQLHNIQAITRSSDTSMAGLRDRIIDVASASKFMSTEVAQAAVTLGQAGLSAKQIGDALKAVTDLAAASGSTLENTVNIITSAMGAFNLNADEATNIANLFTAALNQSKLTMDQLTQGFTYASNSAAQLGISYEDLTTLLASLSNAGIKSGSILGTNLRSLFQDLSAPSEKFQKTLARLGVSLDDLDVKTHPVIEVLRTLHDAGFTAADAMQTLDRRSAAAYVALAGQLGNMNELQQSLIATSAATEAAQKQMGSLANTAKQTASAFTSVASVAFQPMIDGTQVLLSHFNSILSSVRGLKLGLEAIGAVLTGIAASAGAKFVGSIFASAGGSTSRIDRIAKAASYRASTRGVLSGLSFLAGGPTGLAIAGGAAALTGIIAYLGQAKAAQDALTASVEEAKGKADQEATSYKEVQSAIVDLESKEQSLRNSKEDLKTEAVELGARFRALGLDVNGLEGDFDGLLNKLKDLDSTQRDALKSSLNLLQARQQAELAGLSKDSALNGSNLHNLLQFALPGFQKTPAFQKLYARTATGGNLGAEDLGLIQNAQAALLRTDTGEWKYAFNQIKDGLDKSAESVGKLAEKTAQLKKTTADIDVVNAKGDNVFPALEETTRLFLKQFGAPPKRTGLDPVKSQQALAAYLNAHRQDYNNLVAGYAAYAGNNPARQQAVAEAPELKRLQDLFNDTQGKIDTLAPEADRQRAELTSIIANAAQHDFETLERAITQADTPQELQDTATTILSAIPALFKKKADEFAQKNLGLRPDEYSVDTDTYNIGISSHAQVSETQRAQAKQFHDQFVDSTIGPLNNALNTRADQITERAARTKIASEELLLRAIQRDITDAFKNTDQYTTPTEIRKRAEEAQKALLDWYDLNLKILQDQLDAHLITQSDFNNRKATLDEQKADRQSEIDDKTKNLKYETNRPPGSVQDIYDIIRNSNTDWRAANAGVSQLALTIGDTLNAAIQNARTGLSQFFDDIETGTKSAGQAFKDLAKGILESMLKVINDRLAQMFVDQLLKFIPDQNSSGGGGGGFLSSIGSFIGSLFGGGGGSTAAASGNFDFAFASAGGYIRPIHRATGGSISARDTIPAMLENGEYVLRPSAVAAIGRDNLDMLNNMGNSHISKSSRIPAYQPPKPAITNVYVVQPDQPPQLGKDDILVTVQQDMLSGGMTKKLVKSIAAGH